MIGDRLIWLAATVFVVILVAGLTHFTAILILPNVATKDAYTLLAAQSGTNHMTLLAPSRPGDKLIPFRDPVTIQGVCFYDLAQSPMRIRTKTEEGRLLTLSFRTPEGKIFYAMTDRAALRNAIDIRLVTGEQLKAVEDTDDDDAGLPSELRLKSPTRTGLIVATALIARPSEAKDAEERIKSVLCAPEALPKTEPEG